MQPFGFLLLLLISLISGQRQLCVQPATYRFGRCYTYWTGGTNWYDAQQTCNDHGGTLAEPDMWDENNLLKRGADIRQAYCVWLGLTDRDTEGVWKYASTGRTSTFTAWYSTQPDNYFSEECVNMFQPYGYAWNDGNCYYDLCDFICQRPPIS